MILEKLAILRPKRILDVGCGCGSFTAKLSQHCRTVTAIDISKPLIERCRAGNTRSNTDFICMDGREIGFPDRAFDLVLERASLHHVKEWDRVLDEMIRVSSRYVLIEEPVDDPRSEGKVNAIRGERLFLEVQAELGESHFEHIDAELLLGSVRARGLKIEAEFERSDEEIGFDDFFEGFDRFAERSPRKNYWYQRLADFRTELNGKRLCRTDSIMISASK